MTLSNSRFGQLQAAIFAVTAIYAGWQSWQLSGDWIRDGAGAARFVGLALCIVPALLLAWCAVRSLRQGVTIGPEGLRVRNILTSRSISWSEVGGFTTGPTAADSPIGEVEWWGVQVLLRGSERMVRIQGSFARNRERAEAFATQLRSLAPSSLYTGDSLCSPREIYPTAGSASTRRRYVVHSWAISKGGAGGVRTFLMVCVFLVILVGVILVMDGATVAGALLIAGSCVPIWLLVLSLRPRLVVTARGLRPGRRRFRSNLISWSDVQGARVIESANAWMTKRVSHLEVLTSRGPVPLWATLRPIDQIDQVCQHIVSFAVRPPS